MFVRAQEGPPRYGETPSTVLYFDREGNMVIRSNGTRAWRNNNPGNLVANHYTMSKELRAKAIGKAEGHAVYPDYATGHQALVDMLGGQTWGKKTLRKASRDYTPDNPQHIESIVLETGLSPDRTIRSLNKKEFEAYWKAIEKIEKWIEGESEPIPAYYVTGIHMKRGVIQEYCILKSGTPTWISKQEAISLVQEYRLHATLVHAANGTLYLRPKHKNNRFFDLIC